MGLDPAAGFPLDADARRADKMAELERRIRRLEGGNPRISSGAGAPTADAATLRTGTAYIDTNGTGRLYYVVAGAWRSVALA